MADIEFFFDCSSPWTYLAFHNVQPLAREFGATIRWRPILVGGVFNAVNPSVYATRNDPVPVKMAYAVKSRQDWARFSGIVVNAAPKVFPVNSVKVMRACLVLEAEGKLQDFARAAFEAYWRDDLDISADEVARGGFGSPTVFVGGDDMYFGNDHLPLVRSALQARRARA